MLENRIDRWTHSWVFRLLLAMAAVYGFTVGFGIDEKGRLYAEGNAWGVFNLAALVGIAVLYRGTPTWRGELQTAFGSNRVPRAMLRLSAVFALFCIFGKSYLCINTWRAVFFLPLTSVVSFAGLFMTFYAALLRITCFLVRSAREDAPAGRFGRALAFVFEQHPALAPMAVMLAFELPYLIAFYPGVVSYDAAEQIAQFLGNMRFEWHSPALVTFLFGSFVRLSQRFGNPNLWMGLFVCGQSLFVAFGFSMIFVFMKRLKTRMGLRIAALAYFALFPLWPNYAVTLIKDSFLNPLYVMYTALLMLLVQSRRAPLKRAWTFCAGTFVLIMGMILVAHNAFYAFLLSFPALALVFQGRCRISVLASTLALVLCYSGVVTSLWPALGVNTSEPSVEPYCVPLLQTARYVQLHGDEVTAEEREVLSYYFNYEKLLGSYNPDNSDPTRNTLLRDETHTRLLPVEPRRYLKVWLAQGLKHPITYIEAFLNHCYGYFYPERKETKEGLGWYESEYLFGQKQFNPQHLPGTTGMRRWLRGKAEALRSSVPLIGMFYSCGLNTWCLMYITVLLLAMRKRAAVIPCLPSLVNLAIYTFASVNAYIRYSMPLFAVTPLLLAWLIHHMRQAAASGGSALPREDRSSCPNPSN